jgi:hypothetical protein
MKAIGIREFRDKATHYLSSKEAVAIKRHNGESRLQYQVLWESRFLYIFEFLFSIQEFHFLKHLLLLQES